MMIEIHIKKGFTARRAINACARQKICHYSMKTFGDYDDGDDNVLSSFCETSQKDFGCRRRRQKY